MRSKIVNLFRQKPRRWTVDLDGKRLYAQKYAGYVIIYSEGTSLVSDLQTASDLFEPDLVMALLREIKSSNAKIFLDIGANIGLISLALLKQCANLHIEAFDPGPHQSKLFAAAIQYNHLESRIHLHRVALGNRDGEADFFVHANEHASGDGLVDTGRAGDAERIRVVMQRLDNWWEKAGKPHIPVIKIDTEGAELLILKGSVQLLNTCRPTLFLEIWPDNLRNYPYTAEDILIWLHENRYSLETLTGEIVRPLESDCYWGHEVTFVARPIR